MPESSEETINESVILDELHRLVEDMLEDNQRLKTLLETKGEDAQLWLDVLHVLTKRSEIAKSLRSSILKMMLKLSKNSGLCPRCLMIENVKRLGDLAIAEGGFGQVWKGKIGENAVCLKVVKIYQVSDVPKLLKEYMREAIVWQQLEHPNLLPFIGMYYLDEGQNQLCLVSPWMERGSLVAFLKETPRAHVDHYSLVYDVASGLSYLHNEDIVHGDLKGVNILTTPDERACIADFGLSRIHRDGAHIPGLTSSKVTGGTVRYLSPELLIGGSTVTFSKLSDIYAFACVCYEIFEGNVPFHELRLDPSVVLAVVIEKEHPSRPESTSLNDTMWNIMMKCWNANPDLRPAASDILEEITVLFSLQTGGTIEPARDWDVQGLGQTQWKNPHIELSELMRFQKSFKSFAAAPAPSHDSTAPIVDAGDT
ncbi:kinase-like protein [Marasmius fiardii PR-910]|nr:kinase-like protein [Marasmius fiardii PR-910]